MNRLFLAIAILASSCASASPRLSNPAAFAGGVRTGSIDPERFDFAAAGFFEHDAATRAAWLAATLPLLQPSTREAACQPDYLRLVSARPWAELAAVSADETTWTQNVAALRAWTARLDALVATKTRGEERDLTGAALTLQSGLNESRNDSRLQDLFKRTIGDQTLRSAVTPAAGGAAVVSDAAGMPAPAAQSALMALATRVGTADCSNTRWLRMQLTNINWFDIPTYGEAADLAAGFLAIHADNDPDFQLMVARRLEALPNTHTNKVRMANLYDRALVAQNRLQRYGIQGECAARAWRPAPIEDVSHVDERRGAMGLSPLADYIANQAAAFCAR